MKNVHIIITGGTIDSFYDGTIDTVRPAEKSLLPEYFQSVKPYAEITFTTVCMKDSRDLDDNDRKKIKDIIDSSESENFIITHGTYTMPDTARYLKEHIDENRNIKIVLTGAMIPMHGFLNSDGAFNLGFAFAKVEDLAPGVYVLMNGRVFQPEEAVKKVEEGRFESLFNET